MGVLKPRNRLVNFRLSEEEFLLLRNSCALAGARSVSDFARTAVLTRLEQLVDSTPKEGPRLAVLDQKVADLESRLSQLLSLMRAVNEAGRYEPSAENGGQARTETFQTGLARPAGQF